VHQKQLESPLSRYQSDLNKPGFIVDAAQRQAVEQLERLFDELVSTHRYTRWEGQGFLAMLRRLLASNKPVVRGLYLWGGVGRGKTYLMDLFYESLPFDARMRTHFHRFMRRVHQALTALKNQKNPLDLVADQLAAEARVICFDEFFVVDIADAMILANLLKALFERGVVLVATSNVEPDRLYEDGLQRSRFLPAIEWLKQHVQVLNVDGGTDYRLRTLEQATLYYLKHEKNLQKKLMRCFNALQSSHALVEAPAELLVEGRPIRALRRSDDIVWFDFRDICDGPRSQNDYIEVAREYRTVIIEGVPLFAAHNDDQARRFIFLVDEFYDRNVTLVIAASAPIQSLYGDDGRLAFEFQRTVSRVQEMQSKAYLARPHRP